MGERQSTEKVKCARCGAETPHAKAEFTIDGSGYWCSTCSMLEKIHRYELEAEQEELAERRKDQYFIYARLIIMLGFLVALALYSCQ